MVSMRKVIILLLLAGCNSAPLYTRPNQPVPWSELPRPHTSSYGVLSDEDMRDLDTEIWRGDMRLQMWEMQDKLDMMGY